MQSAHTVCRFTGFLTFTFSLLDVRNECFFRLFILCPQLKASVNAFMGTMVNLRRLFDEADSSLQGGDSSESGSGSTASSVSRFSVQMHWKVHSMGSHLMLGLVERAHWAKEPLSKLFSKVILDAPDVPTWEFREQVSRLAAAGVHVLHLFNPNDQVDLIARALSSYPSPVSIMVSFSPFRPLNCALLIYFKLLFIKRRWTCPGRGVK